MKLEKWYAFERTSKNGKFLVSNAQMNCGFKLFFFQIVNFLATKAIPSGRERDESLHPVPFRI